MRDVNGETRQSTQRVGWPRPRNVFARNWSRHTLDVTVSNAWRLGAGRRTFKVFTAGPTEHSYHLRVGPVRVHWWPKSAAAVGGGS